MYAAFWRKELRELVLGRAFWSLLAFLSVLVGIGYRQALELYNEASRAAVAAPELGRSLSPFDGIVVPTFGALYLVTTLLWPFVAIRQLGADVQSGAMKLWLQVPVPTWALVATKVLALGAGWIVALFIPASALLFWRAVGGHLAAWELASVVAGHTLYAGTVVALSLAIAAWTESVATASLLVLAATLGSWALDFASAGGEGLFGWLGPASLTSVLRPWERGLLVASGAVSWTIVCIALLVVARIGLDHGHRLALRMVRAAGVVLVAAVLLALVAGLRYSKDMTEDRRNSFGPEEEAVLARLPDELRIDVFLRPEDPRSADLDREVLSKLRRQVRHIAIRAQKSGSRFASGTDEHYGEIVYTYRGRSETSRSTSPEEVLPLIWRLSGESPRQASSSAYPGYPLVASPSWNRAWFFGILPALVAAGAAWSWWWPWRIRGAER